MGVRLVFDVSGGAEDECLVELLADDSVAAVGGEG